MNTPNDFLNGKAKVINHDSPLPYYYQLKEFLVEQIESGKWESGHQLPTESDLCERFDVSRTVVRRALQEMVYEGLLYRRKGKGTFVTNPKISQEVSFLKGFEQKMRDMGYTPCTQVLEATTSVASPYVKEKLQLSSGEQVYKIRRLRYVDDEPRVLQTVFLPERLFPDLLCEDLSTSLTSLMYQKYGLTLTGYSAVMTPVLANGFEAKVLSASRNTPLMLIEGISIAGENHLVRFSKGVYRADALKFIVKEYSVEIKKDPLNSNIL